MDKGAIKKLKRDIPFLEMLIQKLPSNESKEKTKLQALLEMISKAEQYSDSTLKKFTEVISFMKIQAKKKLEAKPSNKNQSKNYASRSRVTTSPSRIKENELQSTHKYLQTSSFLKRNDFDKVPDRNKSSTSSSNSTSRSDNKKEKSSSSSYNNRLIDNKAKSSSKYVQEKRPKDLKSTTVNSKVITTEYSKQTTKDSKQVLSKNYQQKYSKDSKSKTANYNEKGPSKVNRSGSKERSLTKRDTKKDILNSHQNSLSQTAKSLDVHQKCSALSPKPSVPSQKSSVLSQKTSDKTAINENLQKKSSEIAEPNQAITVDIKPKLITNHDKELIEFKVFENFDTKNDILLNKIKSKLMMRGGLVTKEHVVNLIEKFKRNKECAVDSDVMDMLGIVMEYLKAENAKKAGLELEESTFLKEPLNSLVVSNVLESSVKKTHYEAVCIKKEIVEENEEKDSAKIVVKSDKRKAEESSKEAKKFKRDPKIRCDPAKGNEKESIVEEKGSNVIKVRVGNDLNSSESNEKNNYLNQEKTKSSSLVTTTLNLQTAEIKAKVQTAETKDPYADILKTKATKTLKADISKTKDTKTKTSNEEEFKTEISKVEDLKTKIYKTKDSKSKEIKTKIAKTKSTSNTNDSTLGSKKIEDLKAEVVKDSKKQVLKTKATKNKSSKLEDLKSNSKLEDLKSNDSKVEVATAKSSKPPSLKTKASKTKASKRITSKTEASKTKPNVEEETAKSTKTKAITSKDQQIKASETEKIENSSKTKTIKSEVSTKSNFNTSSQKIKPVDALVPDTFVETTLKSSDSANNLPTNDHLNSTAIDTFETISEIENFQSNSIIENFEVASNIDHFNFNPKTDVVTPTLNIHHHFEDTSTNNLTLEKLNISKSKEVEQNNLKEELKQITVKANIAETPFLLPIFKMEPIDDEIEAPNCHIKEEPSDDSYDSFTNQHDDTFVLEETYSNSLIMETSFLNTLNVGDSSSNPTNEATSSSTKFICKISKVESLASTSTADDIESNFESPTSNELIGSDLFKCNNCKIGFDSSETFLIHLSIASCLQQETAPQTLYTCTHCQENYKDGSELTDHIRLHGIKNISCSLCEHQESHYKLFKKHFEVNHAYFGPTVIYPVNLTQKNPDTDYFLVKPRTLGLERNSTGIAPKAPSKVTKQAATSATSDTSGTTYFSLENLRQLPARPYLTSFAECSLCGFRSKVRLHFLRHMSLHKSGKC